MITKQLGKIVYAWSPDAFNGKGYWFVLGKNGGLGRAASKGQAKRLGRPKQEVQPQQSPEETQEETPQDNPDVKKGGQVSKKVFGKKAKSDTATPADDTQSKKSKKDPFKAGLTTSGLQDIKSGDSLGIALSKLYAIVKVSIEHDKLHDEQNSNTKTDEERALDDRNEDLIRAVLGSKKKEKGVSAPTKVEKVPKQPKAKPKTEAKVEKPKAEKVPESKAPKTKPSKTPEAKAPKSKAEKVAPKEVPKPSAEAAAPAASTSGKVAKAVVIGGALVGLTTLGSSSAAFESGGDPGKVSSGMIGPGKPDPGGISYGTYQMTSTAKGGNVADDFVKKSKYKEEFQGLKAGTPEFSSKWREVAVRDKKEFADAQHDYIKRTHYDPASQEAKKMGFKTDDAGVADAIWSLSVQHGKYKKVLGISKQIMGGTISVDPKQQIKALYAARNEYTSGQFSKRYNSEVEYALKKSGSSLEGTSQPVAPVNNSGSQLDSSSKENKDLKTPAPAVPVILNNTTNITSIGGTNQTVINAAKPSKAPLMQVQGQ